MVDTMNRFEATLQSIYSIGLRTQQQVCHPKPRGTQPAQRQVKLSLAASFSTSLSINGTLVEFSVTYRLPTPGLRYELIDLE